MNKPEKNTSTPLTDLTPAHLIHPGEILIDELEARGISQIDFAKTLDLPRSQVNEYIKGKRDFTTELCLLVARALGMDESIWLQLKQNYEVDRIKMDKKAAQKLKELEEMAFIDDLLPKKYLKSLGVITDDNEETISNTRNLYDVNHLSDLSNKVEERSLVHYRKSQKSTVETIHLFTWEKLVHQKAKEIHVANFNPDNQQKVISGLKAIFRENSNAFEKSAALLAQNGIKLIHQPKPEKCAVDGVSFWSNDNPAIGLSLRYNRIDNLAFTLMHELGHVYLHLSNQKGESFIDVADENGSYGDSPKEEEADIFAQDALIPRDAWEQFEIRYFKPIDIDFIAFAKECDIHPAIPFGRYCYKMKQFKKRTGIDRELR